MRSVIVVVVAVLFASPAWALTEPALPAATVDTTMPTVNGSTLNATCATLQAQLNAAAALNVNLTHEVILATGTLCTGPFVLPSHNGGTGWILVKGANHASLPASGTRVSVASHASLMPQIQYGEDGSVAHVGAFSAATGAQRYRVIGIDMVENTAKQPNWAFVQMGYAASGATNTGYIILDRVIIRNRAWATGTNARRGVYGDAQLGNTALIDSVVMGIADNTAENQAWVSISNPGPILIQNNFLEATGENVMFCGATPASSALMPSDITVKLNTFTKQSAWFGASGYTVKTSLEPKCGLRLLIEANDFFNMPGNDGGYVFRMLPRNDDYVNGTATFLTTTDMTVRYNYFNGNANWVNAFGSDDDSVPECVQPCITVHNKRWKFHDNLIIGLGTNCVAGADCGTVFQIATGGGGKDGTNTTASFGGCTDGPTSGTCKIEDLQILHNTIHTRKGTGSNGASLMPLLTDGMLTLYFKDNLIAADTLGSFPDKGEGISNNRGTTRLNEAVSGPGRVGPVGWVFTGNRIAHTDDGNESTWTTSFMPTGNTYVSDYANFLWVNPCTTTGATVCTGTFDYTLQAGSPAKNAASDGADQGVRFTAYNAARAGLTVGGSSGGASGSIKALGNIKLF